MTAPMMGRAHSTSEPGDDLRMVGAFQLRWHTALSGAIEMATHEAPDDLEAAVVAAWRRTRDRMPDVRGVLDRYAESPMSNEMARILRIGLAKDRMLMAVMAGLASELDDAAVVVGHRLEIKARTGASVDSVPVERPAGSLAARIKAVLAA